MTGIHNMAAPRKSVSNATSGRHNSVVSRMALEDSPSSSSDEELTEKQAQLEHKMQAEAKETLAARLEERLASSENRQGLQSSKAMLQHLMEMWRQQLSDSFRPSVALNPEMTAENNLARVQEQYPSDHSLQKVRAAGVVIETVSHMKHTAASAHTSTHLFPHQHLLHAPHVHR